MNLDAEGFDLPAMRRWYAMRLRREGDLKSEVYERIERALEKAIYGRQLEALERAVKRVQAKREVGEFE